MNNRIKELAQQTDVWCDQNHHGDKFYDIRWEEKFAELIVKECASICKESGWVPAVLVSDDILLHFGVEE